MRSGINGPVIKRGIIKHIKYGAVFSKKIG
jgi:hypothetical protein